MKTNLLIVFALVLFTAASCVDKKKYVSLESNRDSLQTELNNVHLELTEYFTLVSDIESNINEIKEREKMISVAQENNAPDDKTAKNQIVSDLKAINNLMEENRSNIADLNKKLQGSNYQTGKFKKMAEELEKRITVQEEEITTLNLRVEELLASNEGLNLQVDSLFSINTSNTEIIAQKESAMQQLDDQLHTAYYTTGTSAELIEKQIINKEGGFIGIGKVERLNPQINKDQLNVVDTRLVESIPVNTKELELVTEHPQESYEIVMNEEEKKVESIVILDPDKFWESSKVLVMLTK